MMRSTFPLFLVAGAASCLIVAGSSSALAKTVELRNDTLQNNSDSAAVCGFAVGEKFAARFTPPAYPARILKVRVLIGAVELNPSQCSAVDIDPQIEMPMEVFHFTSAVPGTSLGEFTGFAYSTDSVLNELDVNASNLTIDDGSFIVAYTLAQTNASPVHDASNAAIKDSNFIFGNLGQGDKWYSFQDLAAFNADPKGNWVIRLDVSVPDDADPDAGTGGTGGSGSDAGTGGAGGSAGEGGVGGSAGDGGTGGGATGGTGGSSGTLCAKNTDCTGGQTCDTDLGKCVQVSCSEDMDCSGGYVCRTDICRKLCKSVSDCRGGESCDESSGVTVCMSGAATPPASDAGDDGGCVTAGAGTAGRSGIAAIALALGLALSRIVRRERRSR